jgi:hypothetical protein
MIRVLVKASSPVVRTGLEQMIASEPDIHIIQEARARPGRRDAADEEPPDIIVAEIEEPDEESPWAILPDVGGPDTALFSLLICCEPEEGESCRAASPGMNLSPPYAPRQRGSSFCMRTVHRHSFREGIP